MTHVEMRQGLSRRLNWNVASIVNDELVGAILFSLKTFGAALLALLIAFWLGLDDPRWSMLTVYVVSQPDSGLVLAKSFYRLLGTIGGVLITVALVFALAQYGELFLISLAVWIGLCNFAARATRNFASYGIQLAGYTLAIVGIPAALNPAGAYPLILARFTEIVLGIGCAALVSRLVFPGELVPKVLARARELVLGAKHLAGTAMESGADRQALEAEIVRLATEFGAVEALRQSAFFESADARQLDRPLRRLTYAAAALCIVAGAASARSSRAKNAAVPGLDTGDLVQDNAQRVSALMRAADCRALSQASQQLSDAEEALDREQVVLEPFPARRLWSDPITAALVGLRSALAVAIGSFIWLATAWPNGPTAVVVAAVICTLIAAIERPDKISLALGITVLIAIVPAFLTQFYLLPHTVDFASMALALAPVLLACGFIMAQPKIGSLGLLAAVYFAFASNIDNVMTYDAVSFLNSSLAILVGIGLAAVLFATFFPETLERMSRRFCRRISARMRDFAADAGASVETLEFSVYEQLALALPALKAEFALGEMCLLAAEAAQSGGRAITQLRAAIATGDLSPGITAELSRLLDSLSQAYANPSRSNLVTSAWKARAVQRLSRIAVRNVRPDDVIDPITNVIVGCEMLRFALLRARPLGREARHVR